MKERLYRSSSNRMIAGVCGGLAEYFDMDPTVVRLIAVLTLFIGFFPSVIAYIVLAIVVPAQDSTTTRPEEMVKENVREMKQTATEIGKEIQSTFTEEKPQEARSPSPGNRGTWTIGIIIIVIGIVLLITTLIDVWRWWVVGPVILIIIGLLLIFARRKR